VVWFLDFLRCLFTENQVVSVRSSCREKRAVNLIQLAVICQDNQVFSSNMMQCLCESETLDGEGNDIRFLDDNWLINQE